MNYEAMWNKLKAQIESDLKYHQGGIMQSIGESVYGAQKCEEILYYMKDIEKQQELLKTGIVGTYVGTPIIINNECTGCIHYDGCGYFDFDNSDLTEEEGFAEHCAGCCCGDGFECNKNNGCDNWEDGSEPLMG